MYEWEVSNPNLKKIVESRKLELRKEISRICNVTLGGDFIKKEDRDYWVKKAAKLNGELAAIEKIN